MSLVDHDTFLKKLANLFESTRDHGSIWLTHKRLTHDGADAAMAEAGPSDDTQEYPCLVRVTNGKGVKFSTKVESSQLIKFHALYGALLKTSMTATLRKRDKKREKQHAEEAAKRKKRMTEPVKLTPTEEGGQSSKRGKGRRQHQRKIRALLKQQEAQKKHREREEAAAQKASAVVV